MHVDSNGSLAMSPISARGQDRLARLRATIQHQFTGSNNTAAAVAATTVNGRAMVHQQQQQHHNQPPQHPRTKIRQRIEQAARMTSDEIFFREFGSPKQLVAIDFDLARTEPPRMQQQQHESSAAVVNASQRAPIQTLTAQHSATTFYHSSMRSMGAASRAEPPRGVAASMAQPALAGSSAAAMRVQAALDHIHTRSQQLAEHRAESSSASMALSAGSYGVSAAASTHHAPAYVSQLQRPSRIVTPKKASLKRPRTADEPPSTEKLVAPPAQKPRLLTDVTSTFNNRSFSNVVQARGSSSSTGVSTGSSSVGSGASRLSSFLASPVRKASASFSRTTMLQLPSPSKFRTAPQLFGQRQSSAAYR